MENAPAERTNKPSKYLPPSARRLVLSLLALALLVIPAMSVLGSRAPAHAASPPPLGAAATFAVLGAQSVTNTGPTVLTGDLGVSPGTSCTGFPAPCTGGPGMVTGMIHAGDPTAAAAQTDAHTAYANAAGQTCNVNLTGQDLGGKTLAPGVYCFSTSASLTGNLTLSGNGVFIFQMGSTLTTVSNSKVLLTNGATAANVFWQVGSSATLGTFTSFNGSILANIKITATTGVSSHCGLYALTDAVTLDTNHINVCSAPPPPPPTMFSGEGIVAKATIGTLPPVTICDTGPLPSAGTPGVSCGPIAGTFSDPLVSGTIDIASADSSTSGSTVTTHASATRTALTLAGVLGLGVNADLLSSIAQATCTNGRPSVFGDSTILNLNLAGLVVSGHQMPNTTLINGSLFGLTVLAIANEQIKTANSITVNALHIHITDPLGVVSPIDLVVASSHADVNCGGPPCTEPPNSDKIEHVKDGPKDRNTEPGSGECED